jgi:nucleotide-binding universal stress UspA family protein
VTPQTSPVFLVPVDGSAYSNRALDYVIRRVLDSGSSAKVHIVNVQMPLVGVNVKLFVSAESLQSLYREEGHKIIDPALETLRAAGITGEAHLRVGEASEAIIDVSRDIGATEIVMGSHGRGALAGALMGSVAQKVVHQSEVPVVLLK